MPFNPSYAKGSRKAAELGALLGFTPIQIITIWVEFAIAKWVDYLNRYAIYYFLLHNLGSKKKQFDPYQFLGKIKKCGKDGVEYQKMVRECPIKWAKQFLMYSRRKRRSKTTVVISISLYQILF